MKRAAMFAVAAAVLVCLWLGVPHLTTDGPGAGVFAQTLKRIDKCKTITWKEIFYEHVTSKDGKNTWVNTELGQCAYRAPGFFREVRLDKNGTVTRVEITDWARGRRLTYFPDQKKAVIAELAPSPEGWRPFGDYREKLNAPNLQWVRTQKTATGEANIFRAAFPWYVGRERNWSYDFWIDAKTKQLVALYSPGADVYDPEKDPARNNAPEKDWSRRKAMGSGHVEICYDVALEDSLFRLEPPEGYTVETKPRPHVTEKEMIDYLGILADFNDKTFPDEAYTPWNLLDKINRALKKPPGNRTAAEQKLLDTDMRYSWRFGTVTNAPILVFFSWDPDSTVKDSFRYLGKGVKLGDKGRIVCWYKLKHPKDPKTYRVVYGDLSVKDVAPEDLPLSVQP